MSFACLSFFTYGSTPRSLCPAPLRCTKHKARMLPMLGEPAGSHRLQGCHGFCRKKKKQKPRQPLAASSSHTTSFGTPSMAPVATLAGGSLKLGQCPQPASLIAATGQPFSRRRFFLLLLTHGQYRNTNAIKNKALRTGYCPNTPKHNSKVTGMVVKADKGTLRQPQKIFLFLLPENQKGKTKRVFFGLPLHLCHPACVTISIMFKCIVRCKLGSWWLLIYVYRSPGLRFYFLRHTGWYYIRLLWLSFSLSKLPF